MTDLDIFEGDTVNVMFNLDVNSFQGKDNIQFIIKDITLSDQALSAEIAERELASSILNGTYDYRSATSQDAFEIVPAREDFKTVYNTLRRELRMEHSVFSIRALGKLLSEDGYDFKYVKLKLIIKIFQ